MHVPSVKKIVEKCGKEVRVITNEAVSKLLGKKGVEHEVLEDRGQVKVNGVNIEAINGEHETIYGEFGRVMNTGFFIGGKLFYPGDSFCDPEKEVEILALPVAGPWCKIGDAVKYALEIKPKKAFPVHDGMLNIKGANHFIPSKFLPENGIEFVVIKEGESYEFS